MPDCPDAPRGDDGPLVPIAWLSLGLRRLTEQAHHRMTIIDAEAGSVLLHTMWGADLVLRRRTDRLWPETEVLARPLGPDDDARDIVGRVLGLGEDAFLDWTRPGPPSPQPPFIQIPLPEEPRAFRYIAELEVPVDELTQRLGIDLPLSEETPEGSALIRLADGSELLLEGLWLYPATTELWADPDGHPQNQVDNAMAALGLDRSCLAWGVREIADGPERLRPLPHRDYAPEAGWLRRLMQVWLTPEQLAERAGLEFHRPDMRPRIRECWAESTSGFRYLLRCPDDLRPARTTEIWKLRYDVYHQAYSACFEALDLDASDIAYDCYEGNAFELVGEDAVSGVVDFFDDDWASGLIVPADGGPPVAVRRDDAVGNPAFLQWASRVVFLREHTTSGPVARHAHWHRMHR